MFERLFHKSTILFLTRKVATPPEIQIKIQLDSQTRPLTQLIVCCWSPARSDSGSSCCSECEEGEGCDQCHCHPATARDNDDKLQTEMVVMAAKQEGGDSVICERSKTAMTML